MGRRAALLVALCAAVLVLGTGRATAYCCPLQNPQAMLLSPDGRFGYVIDPSGTTIVRRDASSGALSAVDGSALRGEEAAMSPDSAFLYVADFGRITPARRDQDTGLLTPGPVAMTPDGGAVRSVAVSPDGRNLYASEQNGGPILVYARDAATGALTYVGAGPGPTSTSPSNMDSLTLTKDGRYLYAGGYGLVFTYARDAATGALTPGGMTDTTGAGPGLLLGPDETRLYAGSNRFAVLARDAGTGASSLAGSYDLTADSVTGPTVLAPDGRDLYVVAWGALSHVSVAADALVARQTYRNYAYGVRGLRGARVIAVAPDGRHVYVATGSESGASAHVVTFGRDAATGDLAYQGIFDPARDRPPGRAPELRFSIDHGAKFTRDRNVTLTFNDPYLGVEVSNDGGFRNAKPFEQVDGPARSYPWTLASSGPERLPKTVYARTTGPIPEAAQDEILLDERPPEVVSASLLGARGSTRAAAAVARRGVRVVARDRVSGVAQVQLAARRARPGHWRRYRARALYPAPRGAQQRVRVRDRAGNVSRWRRVLTVRHARGRR